jgi:U3 small nucleolar RNA-associated protein 12
MTVLQATLLASIPTQSSARVARVRFSVDGRTVGVQFANRSLQLFGVRDEEQLRKRHKRKDTRLKRRAEAADGEAAPSVELTGEETAAAVEEAAAAEAAAQLQPLSGLRASHKLHSFSFLPGAARGGGGANVRVLAAQRDNSFGVWECELAPHGAATETARVAAAGHRAEPRAIALSADDRYVLSAGDGEAKVWAVGSRQCVRSMASGFALCATFVLGGRYALVGTKAGALQLFSMATGECVHEVEAHGGAVWALALEPGSRGALSASADKRLVAWTIEDATESGEARLSLQREHTLPDDAMCAGYSADAKYVAAGLLDASVLILFHDTFKLYLTLYGHKLPVLALSLSSDGALVATGSADKTLKLWGLDFGDCHRSLLAHSEAVTAVQFVRNTHYVFTCGKDKLVKYWDADTFELILTLPAHHDAVWGVAVSRDGGFITSVGRDRSLRLWRRTEEQVFLEEEREAETDALLEAGLEKQQHTAEAEEEEAAALGLEGAADAAAAGRRTLETVKGAERILEALRVLDDEADRVAEHVQAVELNEARGKAPPVLVPNMLLLGLDAGGYLLKALTSVRAAELEQALLLLPFDAVRRLLERLLPLLPTAPHIELLARSILYTLRVHHTQAPCPAPHATVAIWPRLAGGPSPPARVSPRLCHR